MTGQVLATVEESPRPRPLWTAKATMEFLGYRPNTIYWLMANDPTFPRPLRPLGPNGHPRWRPEEVEDWKRALEQRERTAAAPKRSAIASRPRGTSLKEAR